MSAVGTPERVTQDRVIALFRDELCYDYLGNWIDRHGNANVEETLLATSLTKRGYRPEQITRAVQALRTEARNPNRSAYENNQAVYGLLRYGVDVKITVGENTEKVHLIDWKHPASNHFAVAEEVTLEGRHERRPDLVLYLNGIAVAMLELKNSRISIGDGIRQLISNQQPEFHAPFFATVHLLIAGNDSEGLRYGTTGTEEKLYLSWKEDEADNRRFKLDKYLLKLCAKERLLELLYDFVLYDAGRKKLPRPHQYAGIIAAQAYVRRQQGGIIWHTQGSGKSIVMVLLARWVLENNPHARVLIVTDRDELDKQIEGVFAQAGDAMVRSTSGRHLMILLAQAKPRLICSLVHKFGRRKVGDFEQFIADLAAQPSDVQGQLFVFVDECHRTHSGKLHRTMKALMPRAVFVGFTGTPLLKEDKATSLEVFGGYIHTYKFSEAVDDDVVLDLIYEARDIDQRLGSPDKVDAWFEAKTKALNSWQKAALREQWGTMQRVLSSRSRMERVVQDIVFDFGVKPRLSNGRGNAMLVAGSIHEACRYFDLFQKTVFSGTCAVVTSYNPQAGDITTEDTGANTQTDKEFVYTTYTRLLAHVIATAGKTKTETYEEAAKERFKKQPAAMRLLIVVDKLLTGFDAPSCSFLYIDKSMRDHGLFQAICRTNRLDGEDKDFGYIVDYKDLFTRVKDSIKVYTSELDHPDGDSVDPEVLLKDRLTTGRERLDHALDSLAILCEPVQPPRGELQHIHYFCGNTENPDDLRKCEPQRVALYQSTAALMRAYANIADELAGAGYDPAAIKRLTADITRYVALREIIRKASGETIDLKAYEADMRHLIDTYIEAAEPKTISPFADLPLLELITKSGIAEALDSLPKGIKGNPEAAAETIANNVRSKIIKDHLNDPAFYDRMSALLKEILDDLRAKRIDYAEYLKRIAELAKTVQNGMADDTPTILKQSSGLRALYHNLTTAPAAPTGRTAGEPKPAFDPAHDPALILALRLDEAVKRARPDGWRGIQAREQVVKRTLFDILGNVDEVERIFLIIKQQKEY